MAATCKELQLHTEDETPQKWCVPLTEDVFNRLISAAGSNPTLHKVFGECSLFSPMLFGKFFDPCDAFPLWELDSNVVVLQNLPKTTIDWSETEQDYALKADLPIPGKNNVDLYLENGKIMEISGQWRPMTSQIRDWRCGQWWEHGYVRRLELPEDADWKKIKAYLNNNDTVLEIRIPKKSDHIIN